jgi:hypothetical protein
MLQRPQAKVKSGFVHKAPLKRDDCARGTEGQRGMTETVGQSERKERRNGEEEHVAESLVNSKV